MEEVETQPLWGVITRPGWPTLEEHHPQCVCYVPLAHVVIIVEPAAFCIWVQGVDNATISIQICHNACSAVG